MPAFFYTADSAGIFASVFSRWFPMHSFGRYVIVHREPGRRRVAGRSVRSLFVPGGQTVSGQAFVIRLPVIARQKDRGIQQDERTSPCRMFCHRHCRDTHSPRGQARYPAAAGQPVRENGEIARSAGPHTGVTGIAMGTVGVTEGVTQACGPGHAGGMAEMRYRYVPARSCRCFPI